MNSSEQMIMQLIAQELQVKPQQVAAAIGLLDEGNTVPFIARYRKEATQGLSDIELRQLEERLIYLREMIARRDAIIQEIETQGKMTDELRAALNQADTKARLEDLYRPYKPKRRTRGQIACEAGLLPLAESLLADHDLVPEEVALPYVDAEKGVADIKAALEGARYILMERFADDADLVGQLREQYWTSATLVSKVKEGQEQAGQKFADYFDYSEKLQVVPSHRALAVLRGRNANVLQLSLEADYGFEAHIAEHFGFVWSGKSAHAWLQEVVKWTWQVKLKVQLEAELITRLREDADAKAISVFAANLRDLLMAPPAGMQVTMGVDPGYRTGVKIAIVDSTGKLLNHATIYPHAPQQQWKESLRILAELCKSYGVKLISIGNGTASRETDQLIAELISEHPELNLTKIVVSEAGASVYSASELASNELPDIDVSIRGAVSIARRLQDPLAELVKIEPKSIGVGQYQHDVNQTQLHRSLEGVVEDCVNNVGVDVNTASAALLARVAGLNQQLAENIVSYRNQHGRFINREVLHSVSRLGPKAFEQAAGFLRIMHTEETLRDERANPLDSSAVHPESYVLVNKIVANTGQSVLQLIGNKDVLQKIVPENYTDERFGLPTVMDILKELEKPGRDPRPEFKTAKFTAGVNTIKDLKPGMILEGSVTNVANFGAFVDIGVHQDGLVHISALASKFVRDPRTVVKTGDIVKVKVLEVDLDRKRISLTMILEQPAEAKPNTTQNNSRDRANPNARSTTTNKSNQRKRSNEVAGPSLFGTALMDALKGTGKEENNSIKKSKNLESVE